MKIMSQNVEIAVCVCCCVYFIVLYQVVENYLWFPTSCLGCIVSLCVNLGVVGSIKFQNTRVQLLFYNYAFLI